MIAGLEPVDIRDTVAPGGADAFREGADDVVAICLDPVGLALAPAASAMLLDNPTIPSLAAM